MYTQERLTISLLWGIFAVWLAFNIIRTATGAYELNLQYKNYWQLADRSSTLAQKSAYIDKFVVSLDESDFHGGFNGLFFHTPSNDFDANLEALKSLQTRMHEIQSMNITSFEYQLAIQQITQQEMAEASEMISTLLGVYWKENRILFWNWIGVINWGFLFIFLCIAFFRTIEY